MNNLSNNDIWILRSLAKLDSFLSEKQPDPIKSLPPIGWHLKKMVRINRGTQLQDVYNTLNQFVYIFEGKSLFISLESLFDSEEIHKHVTQLMDKYQSELVQAMQPQEEAEPKQKPVSDKKPQRAKARKSA